MLTGLLIIYLLLIQNIPTQILAADNNFVVPVIPLRNPALWREGSDLRHLSDIKDIATSSGLPITWLVHYDILKDPKIIEDLKLLPKNHEIGLFLEVTQRLAQDSKVFFDWNNGPWSSPHKLYLQGYSTSDRISLIKTFFESYKDVFGKYPKSYGAWYIDGFSGDYIKTNYLAKIQLGLADQYSTDGYQVWGQHLNLPYYQEQADVIEPAKEPGDHILKILWAPREPTLSYGENVEFSNFSLQANDYYRSKNLPHSYFQKTLKTLTTDTISTISGIVIGLEVGEVKKQYLEEFKAQLQTLNDLNQNQNLKVLTMSDFENQYRQITQTTPNSFIQSNHKNESSYWYQTPHYRIGLFIQNNQLILKDLRFYHQSELQDNDQFQKDTNFNLSRVVPALVDKVSLHNSFVIQDKITTPIITDKNPDNFVIKTDSLTITFKSDKIYISPPPTGDITNQAFAIKTSDALIISKPHKTTQIPPRCSNSYGYYAGKFNCTKSFITHLFSKLPTILYTNLSGTHFIGIKTSRETIFALTFPDISLKNRNFDAQIMGSFIDLTQKFTPHFNWYGRQEDQIPIQLKKNVVAKDYDTYGQEKILELIHKPKLFENGRYFAPQP